MTGFITTAVTGVFLLQSLVPVASALANDSTEATPVQPTYPTYSVAATAYTAEEGQTDSTPTITSIGAYTNPTIVVARSADLSDELPYGSVIEVIAAATSTDPNCGYDVVKKKIGLRVVSDAMHHRMKNKIDFLFDTKRTAFTFGNCKDLTIRVVGRIDTKKMPKTQDELKLALETRNIALDANLAVNK